MDKVGIYNMALGRVGISQFVQSTEERSNPAVVCGTFFDNCRQRVLTAFNWNFAKRTASLAEIAGSVNGWLHRYQYPNDCLKVRAVVPDASLLTSPSIVREICREGQSQHFIFEVVENEAQNGKAILSNLTSPVAQYTADINNLNLWTPDAHSALAWLLASEIAGPLSAQPNYSKLAGDTYKMAILEAGALNLNENKPPVKQSSQILDARD